MVGVFDLVDRHLSFDHAWVGAGASSGQQFVEDLGGDASVGIGEGVRRENPGGWRWCPERPGASGRTTICPGRVRNLLPPNASTTVSRSARTGIHTLPELLRPAFSSAGRARGFRDWIATWNTDPKPFVWTKTAEEILNSLARYIARISGGPHQ